MAEEGQPGCFDPNVARVLGVEYDGSLVLNPCFRGLAEHIKFGLSCRDVPVHKERLIEQGFCNATPLDVIEYTLGDYADLFARCKSHADQYRKPLDSENVVVLVHPFYMHLSHMQHVSQNGHKTEADAYLRNMSVLLSERFPHQNADIVLFDTPHHYAAATSLLMEQGKAEQALLTYFDNGSLVKPRDIESLKGKRVFIAGGYIGKCMKGVILDLLQCGVKEINLLNDMLLKNPQGRNIHSIWGPNNEDLNDLPGIDPKGISLEQMIRQLRGFS